MELNSKFMISNLQSLGNHFELSEYLGICFVFLAIRRRYGKL